jgi:UDP-N-acetyl-2-amino-2-deoxyglucuronate dehydrogenase
MLSWIFGEAVQNIVHIATRDTVSGYLEFRKARVRYFLSINFNHMPDSIKVTGKQTYRSVKMDGKEIEFSEGFTDLHTESYRQILAGNGFPMGEVRRAIEIVHTIRNSAPVGLAGEYHPFARF